MPVRGQFDVEFDTVRALFDSQLERGKRILRRMSRCAAMGKNNGIGKGFEHGKEKRITHYVEE